LWLAVVGDGTLAEAAVWVVPDAQPVVIFDVDGTLTTDDGELFDELAGRSPSEMFPDADKVARHWAERGHLIIYLTGRPYFLRALTRAWLDSHAFPPGPLMTTDRVRQAIPGEAGVGAYKTELLRRLLATGISVVRAYGNAATDVCAYARVGLAPDRTFIVGPDARRCDDHPPSMPLNSYTDHLRELGSSQDAR
jgi:phosphatidate phosphatase PAH1